MSFNKFWFNEYRVIARNVLIITFLAQALWNCYGIYTGVGVGHAAFNFTGEYITTVFIFWVAYGLFLPRKNPVK